MVRYKLYYFNLRGRAEVIRYIFVYAGQEFEDVRVEKEDWSKHKPNTPLGQLPYLEVTDGDDVFILSQSVSIARYLARKLGLAGKTEQEQAEVDMYADQVSDLIQEFLNVYFEKDEQRKKEKDEKLHSEIVPNNLKLFEKKLEKSTSGYLFPSGITWCDFFLFQVLEWITDKKSELYPNFPRVKAFDEKVASLPKIHKYRETRPKTAA